MILRATLRSTDKWTDRETHIDASMARTALEARIPEGFELASVRAIDWKGGQPVTLEARVHSRMTREISVEAPSYNEARAKLKGQMPEGWSLLYSIIGE